MKTVKLKHLHPRAIKLSIAPADARTPSGRVKGGVRWTVGDSSTSSDDEEDASDSGGDVLHDTAFTRAYLHNVRRGPAPRARVHAARRARQERCEAVMTHLRQFEEADCGFLAASLLGFLVDHERLSGLFTLTLFTACANLLQAPEHKTCQRYQGILIRVLARVSQCNRQAAAFWLPALDWLPAKLNEILTCSKRSSRGCKCHEAAPEACRLVVVLIEVCRVSISTFWTGRDCSLLGLLWHQLFCPQQACQLVALRALQALLQWDEGSVDSPLQCAQDSPTLLRHLLALLASTNSQVLIRSLANCVNTLLQDLALRVDGELRSADDTADEHSCEVNSARKRGSKTCKSRSSSPLASRTKAQSGHKSGSSPVEARRQRVHTPPSTQSKTRASTAMSQATMSTCSTESAFIRGTESNVGLVRHPALTETQSCAERQLDRLNLGVRASTAGSSHSMLPMLESQTSRVGNARDRQEEMQERETAQSTDGVEGNDVGTWANDANGMLWDHAAEIKELIEITAKSPAVRQAGMLISSQIDIGMRCIAHYVCSLANTHLISDSHLHTQEKVQNNDRKSTRRLPGHAPDFLVHCWQHVSSSRLRKSIRREKHGDWS
jgi:hypothetical protein